MLPRSVVVLLSAMAVSTFSQSTIAETLDINLSDESAQFKYLQNINGTTEGRTELGFGILYNDDDNYLAEASFIITDVAGTKAPGLEVGVGPKLYLAKHDKTDLDAFSIGVGAQFRYKIPTVTRLNFTGAVFYAPGIVSFADAEDLTEIFVSIGYEVLPTADVYLGYRYINVDFDPVSDKTLDETALIGLSFSF